MNRNQKRMSGVKPALPALQELEARTLLSTMELTTAYDPWVDAPVLMSELVAMPVIPSPSAPVLVDQPGLHGTGATLLQRNREAIAQKVATFRDNDSTGTQPEDYVATITWDDGTTSSGDIVATTSGELQVWAAHSFHFGEHSAFIEIRDVDPASTRLMSVVTQYLVAPPPISGGAFELHPVTGERFVAKVATYVGLGSEDLADFHATVNWGDGTMSDATLVAGPDGQTFVYATHEYFDPGEFNVQTNVAPWYSIANMQSLTDANAVANAVVEQGAVYGGSTHPHGYAGPFTAPLARYTTDLAPQDWHFLQAKIVVGDQTIAGMIVPVNDTTFDVVSSFVLTTTVDASVQIYDTRQEEQDWLAARTPVRIQMDSVPQLSFETRVSGQRAQISGVVTDPDQMNYWTQELTIDLDWGDGTHATVPATAQGNGLFAFSATHDYAALHQGRQYWIGMNATDHRTSLVPGPDGPITADITRNSYTWVQIGAAEFDGFDLIASGAWNWYPNLPIALADAWLGRSSYAVDGLTAQIQWDDGSTTFASVNRSGDRRVQIRGYAALSPGVHTGVLTLTGYGQSASVEVRGTMMAGPYEPPPVTYPLLSEVSSSDVSIQRGHAFDKCAAEFRIGEPGVTLDDLTAQCDWGRVTLMAGNDGRVRVLVSGDAMYRDLSNVWVSIRITHKSGEGQVGYLNMRLTTYTEPDQVQAESVSINARRNEQFSSTVARVTLLNAQDCLANYRATIDWGDGTSSDATLVPAEYGTVAIVGTHVYRIVDGTYVVVHIYNQNDRLDVTGSAWVKYDSITIDDSGDSSEPEQSRLQGLVDGQKISGRLGSFTDDLPLPAADEGLVDHAVLIDWGDGELGAGTVSMAQGSQWNVSGGHEYLADGTYNVKMVVRRNEVRRTQFWGGPIICYEALANCEGAAAPRFQQSRVLQNATFLFKVTVSNGQLVISMQAAPDPAPMAAPPVPQAALLPVVAPPLPVKHQWPTPTEAPSTPWWLETGSSGIWRVAPTPIPTLVVLPITPPSPNPRPVPAVTPKPSKPVPQKKPAKPAKPKKPAKAKAPVVRHKVPAIVKTLAKLAKAAEKLLTRR